MQTKFSLSTFAVDLDADKVLVEDGADLRVFEALVLHHVAPVTRRVADRKKNGPIEPFRFREGFIRPGEPVDRIVGVLQEVRTRLVR